MMNHMFERGPVYGVRGGPKFNQDGTEQLSIY